MTVETQMIPAVYRGNNAATNFAYNFVIPSVETAVVQLQDYVSGEILSTLLPSQYAISGVGDPAGGVVMYPLSGAPLTPDFNIIVRRVVPYVQPLDIVNQGGFYPETLEAQLDLTVMQIQQIAEAVGRALVMPEGSDGLTLPALSALANKFLAFDADGNPYPSEGTGADEGLREDLASATGSALVSYTAAGANSLTRSMQTKMREGDISITDKIGGVAGGLATNVTAALVQALADAATQGRNVYIPKTTVPFDLNAQIVIPDGVRLYGPGWLRQTVADVKTLVLGTNCAIEGLKITGINGSAGTDPTLNCAIFGDTKENIEIKDCTISGFEGGGVHLRGCKDIRVKDNFMYGNNWSGHTSYSSSGDVTLYSLALAGRVIIQGNFLLSDMSQSISANVLGFDADSIVQGNVMITMTDDLSGEKPSGSMRCRHGVMISYNGQATQPTSRITVDGNVIRNKLLTGVYGNTSDGNSGGGVVSNNVITKAGMVGADSLAGGIHLFAGVGGWLIDGNFIDDFRGTVNGALTINGAITGGVSAPVVVTGNYVTNSLGTAYFLNGRIRDWYVTGNTSLNAGGADFSITFIGGAGETLVGGLRLTDNKTVRNNTAVSSVEVSASGGVIPRRCIIAGNDFYGSDRTTAVATNTGIRFQTVSLASVSFSVERNTIRRFRFGVQCSTYFPGATRYTDVAVDYNTFEDVEQAICFSATAGATTTYPCEGNRFINVATKFGVALLGGNAIGFEVRRLVGQYEISQAAAPTTGSWAVGDRIWFTAPTASNPPGAVCVTAGAPGTWKNMAALAA